MTKFWILWRTPTRDGSAKYAGQFVRLAKKREVIKNNVNLSFRRRFPLRCLCRHGCSRLWILNSVITLFQHEQYAMNGDQSEVMEGGIRRIK